MPSASSCFLLSFCFRKVVLWSFSECAENLRELFLSRNKSGARRWPIGGPTATRRPPGAAQGLATAGSHLVTSGTVSSCPFAYKIIFDPKTLSTWSYFPEDVQGRRHRQPLFGEFCSSSRHPVVEGNRHRRHLHHHACLRSDAWVFHHGTTGP